MCVCVYIYSSTSCRRNRISLSRSRSLALSRSLHDIYVDIIAQLAAYAMGAAASVYGYTKYSPVYAVLLHESFAKMRRIIGIYMYRYYVFIVHI